MTFDEWWVSVDNRYLHAGSAQEAWNASADRYAPLVEVCKEIEKAIEEASIVDEGSPGDFFHESWNPNVHIEITITISDIRNLVLALKTVTDEDGECSRCGGSGVVYLEGVATWCVACNSKAVTDDV